VHRRAVFHVLNSLDGALSCTREGGRRRQRSLARVFISRCSNLMFFGAIGGRDEIVSTPRKGADDGARHAPRHAAWPDQKMMTVNDDGE
jgi:hypothetical protein